VVATYRASGVNDRRNSERLPLLSEPGREASFERTVVRPEPSFATDGVVRLRAY
jgi:hypothetical protein